MIRLVLSFVLGILLQYNVHAITVNGSTEPFEQVGSDITIVTESLESFEWGTIDFIYANAFDNGWNVYGSLEFSGTPNFSGDFNRFDPTDGDQFLELQLHSNETGLEKTFRVPGGSTVSFDWARVFYNPVPQSAIVSIMGHLTDGFGDPLTNGPILWLYYFPEDGTSTAWETTSIEIPEDGFLRLVFHIGLNDAVQMTDVYFYTLLVDNIRLDTIVPNPVPIPPALILFGGGVAALGMRLRKK